jgi:RNase P/RNase MRP subunit p29
MSKQFEKLEAVLELPSLDSVATPATDEEVAEALAKAKELEQAFDKIDHYDQHDSEMDELAGMAIQAHKDLQDLGMNVEVKHAGEIFSSSSQMLKIAVDAKNNKVEKKLKLLKLQLEKLRIEKMHGDTSNTLDGSAVRLDRNEILKHLKQIGNEDK